MYGALDLLNLCYIDLVDLDLVYCDVVTLTQCYLDLVDRDLVYCDAVTLTQFL